MYGKFFSEKFRKNSLNERQFLFEDYEEYGTDVVLYHPEDIINEYYQEILNANNEEEIHELLTRMFSESYIEGAKKALLVMSQVGMNLLNSIQDDENV